MINEHLFNDRLFTVDGRAAIMRQIDHTHCGKRTGVLWTVERGACPLDIDTTEHSLMDSIILSFTYNIVYYNLFSKH